jgi:hypothetical protein
MGICQLALQMKPDRMPRALLFDMPYLHTGHKGPARIGTTCWLLVPIVHELDVRDIAQFA